MLNDEQIEFIKMEMEKKGIILEDVIDTFYNDPDAIRKLCNDITYYEAERDGWTEWKKNGKAVIHRPKNDYDPYRLIMAEEILEIMFDEDDLILSKVIYIDLDNDKKFAGTFVDYILLDKAEAADILYQRLNRDASPDKVISLDRCKEHTEKIHNDLRDRFHLRYLEEMILFYESNLITNILLTESEKVNKSPRRWAVSKTLDDARMELDSLYYYFFKRANIVKYIYRMGYDINTGKQVAVQFIFEPNKDKVVDTVKMMYSHNKHINHLTNAFKVKTIFTRDNQKFKKVTLIPVANKDLIPILFQIDNECKNDPNKQMVDIINDQNIQMRLFQEIKKIPDIGKESYTVGKIEGEGKYKTTKLFWDFSCWEYLQ